MTMAMTIMAMPMTTTDILTRLMPTMTMDLMPMTITVTALPLTTIMMTMATAVKNQSWW